MADKIDLRAPTPDGEAVRAELRAKDFAEKFLATELPDPDTSEEQDAAQREAIRLEIRHRPEWVDALHALRQQTRLREETGQAVAAIQHDPKLTDLGKVEPIKRLEQVAEGHLREIRAQVDRAQSILAGKFPRPQDDAQTIEDSSAIVARNSTWGGAHPEYVFRDFLDLIKAGNRVGIRHGLPFLERQETTPSSWYRVYRDAGVVRRLIDAGERALTDERALRYQAIVDRANELRTALMAADRLYQQLGLGDPTLAQFMAPYEAAFQATE